jgi:hypothetical protein
VLGGEGAPNGGRGINAVRCILRLTLRERY